MRSTVFRQIVPLVVLVFLRPVQVFAQSQCAQKLSDLPAAAELFGFHIGMTKDDVKNLVPQTQFGKADEFGVVKTTINPYFDTRIDKTKFAGVRSISLDFLDDRLTSLWIGYDETYKVHTTDEFIKQISGSLHLTGTWSSWKSKGQQLRCGDFQIIVSMVAGGPSVRILDVSADDIVAARRLAKEERDEAKEAGTDREVMSSSEPDAEATKIVGDRHDKVYYSAGCTPSKPIEEKNKVVFATVEEAEKNGFKLAKSCH
ncbi:MAG: hypothetical protein C5B55_07295 [Blastocatellia bacterium]|nr:MAG: hypothetical protein C5B55_07295 [Blastocatellia bacterium]